MKGNVAREDRMSRNNPEMTCNKPKRIVELFAGISGLAQGFAETGKFCIQGLLDIDPVAKETFKLNYPQVYYEKGDIKKISPKNFVDRTGQGKPFAVLGCPPCQGLSAAGKRNPKDPRNRLIYEFFRYVAYLKPPVFIIENVPQILLVSNYKQAIIDFADKQGYNIWSGILNSAMFGIPQTRQRALVIAYRSSLGVMPHEPRPTHYGQTKVYSYPDQKMLSTKSLKSYEKVLGWYTIMPKVTIEKKKLEKLLSLDKLVTLNDALDDLPSLAGKDSDSEYVSLPRSSYQKTMRPTPDIPLTAHNAWGHSSRLKARMRRLSEGGVSRNKKYFSQAYSRLHRKGLARTITGNFHNAGCGRFIHFCENRTLSAREAARIQGFPDSFVFAGKPSDHRRLLGNAFPKALASAIAHQVIKDIF